MMVYLTYELTKGPEMNTVTVKFKAESEWFPDGFVRIYHVPDGQYENVKSDLSARFHSLVKHTIANKMEASMVWLGGRP